MLSRNVGFTVIAVLALALGIGMNAAVFTCYKAFFALSLDALNPGQMVNVAVVHPSGHTDPAFSYPDYLAYRDQLHSFGGLIAES
jgi:hypothetical protein